jgi:hypothetical protein
MKALIWSVFALLTLLWTGTAWLLSSLVGWVAKAAQVGDLQAAARAATDWPVPEWVQLWVDPSLIRLAQQALIWAMENLGGLLPTVGSLVGWLSPLIWIVWGLVALLLLVLAAGLHLLAGRHAALQRALPLRQG